MSFCKDYLTYQLKSNVYFCGKLNLIHMKNIFTILCLLVSGAMIAQIETPAASTSQKVEQVVGLTTVNIEYSRPNVKGRTIFAADGLVPFGKLWRTGANLVTKLSFSSEVTVNGQKLEAGDYALLSTPNADNWEFHFHKYEGRYWSSYAEKEPAVSVTSNTGKYPMAVETFTIAVNNVTDTSADIDFIWDRTICTVKLGVEVDGQVMAAIDRVMAGPSGNDYYNAATYYHKAGKDLNQALAWINKATDVAEPRFWQVRRKALILADLGKKTEAIAAAKLSLDLATKAGNDDYVALNQKSIAEWTK